MKNLEEKLSLYYQQQWLRDHMTLSIYRKYKIKNSVKHYIILSFSCVLSITSIVCIINYLYFVIQEMLKWPLTSLEDILAYCVGIGIFCLFTVFGYALFVDEKKMNYNKRVLIYLEKAIGESETKKRFDNKHYSFRSVYDNWEENVKLYENKVDLAELKRRCLK